MKAFINEAQTPIAGYTHFLQGDISGIQEFIFNIKSEGAAKSLKARSYFVQAISELCLHLIEEDFGSENCMLFYNGGGNFYVFVKSANGESLALDELRQETQKALAQHEIYLNLSAVALNHSDFEATWTAIHRQSNQDKLCRYQDFPAALHEPKRYRADAGNTNYWKRFSESFVKNYKQNGFVVNLPPNVGSHTVQQDGFTLFGRMLALDKSDAMYKDSIINKLPQWTSELLKEDDLQEIINELNARNTAQGDKKIEAGDIIEFEALGKFAELRTGTNKVAVLKMDVDNLGNFFRSTKKWQEGAKKSQTLKTFFDAEIYRLWKTHSFGNTNAPYCENLYVVFSGGDDCMVIGAWDAVFEFAVLVRQSFMTFVKAAGIEVSISAGVIMLGSKYPMIRMAELAEEAISQAKKFRDEKNAVCIFDRNMSWDDFVESKGFAGTLAKMILEDGENRSFLHRFQNTHVSFEQMHNKALYQGEIRNPEIWRLQYYLARRKGEAQKRSDVFEDLIEKYQRVLLKSVMAKKPTDLANLFPVAARWAEFLTRSKS